ncbi:MAG: terpene cyclase/mutase family protein [Acidihalobacter sp.]|uniref:prenyltransferase/squalene oxidase repeat-containing protein n=1 Tax=Acidihalobacter sp. TaxID=1872108 RepID=UPI00307E19E5
MTIPRLHALRDRLPLPRAKPEADAACKALARWLAAAQDASGCGGVCAYYDLRRADWAAAYPETTGYIIPTLCDYAQAGQEPEYRERALRMADWECEVQLPDGGVRAGLMNAPQVSPTVFNTGQVLFGWARAFEETGVERYRKALHRAADWLLSAQDEDGAWRRFGSPFAMHTLNTYNTRTAFGLGRVSQVLSDPRYLEAARRNVDWALSRAHPNGWLPDNCLEDNTRPLTHTIAYALRGILEVAALDGGRGLDTVLTAARALAKVQHKDGALPGRLDADWNGAARWSCLTGNAQIAIVWMRLVELTGEAGFLPAVHRALGFNLRTLRINGLAGVAGGIKGSHPVDGGYMRYRYPSWAAKFMLDALLLRRRMG